MWYHVLLLLVSQFAGLSWSVQHDGRFSYYTMPTFESGPCDVTVGPDGAVYVEEILANKVARLDPKTHSVQDYEIPFTSPLVDNSTLPRSPTTGQLPISCALRTGFDGLLYLSNGLRNQLVQMNVTTKEIHVYNAPNGLLGNAQPLNDVTTAPDGVYFTQTTGNVITKFHYDTQEMETFPIPTLGSLPIGIFYASDGGIWFLEFGANKVGRFDRRTHMFKEFALPKSLAGPIVMRAETEKRYLWFASGIGNGIGRIDMYSHAIKAYPVPTPLSLPVELCPSAKGDIFFTHILQNALGVVRNPSGKIQEIPYPSTIAGQSPIGLPPDVGSGIFCRPGNAVWFTQLRQNLLVRYQLL